MAAPVTRIEAARLTDAMPRFDMIIDVRSPAEFADDHIPGAVNLPVLDNVQRAEIGTLYKQVSPFAAKRAGAVLVARNIAMHIDTRLSAMPRDWRPRVYCWRGGQRSGAMARIFSDIGWQTSLVDGGYKAYRRHIVNILEMVPPTLRLIVLAGRTGSAKTRILQAAQQKDVQIIDLEGLACHRGSLLGSTPDMPQPSQRLFESRLAYAIAGLDPNRPVVVEAESNKIGQIHIPPAFWARMRSADRVTIDAPLAARVAFLEQDYAHIKANHESLAATLSGLRFRHSRSLIADWDAQIKAKAWTALVTSLLESHYDPAYDRSAARRNTAELARLNAVRLDPHAIDQLATGLAAVVGQ